MQNDKLSQSIGRLLRHIDRDPERFEREFSEVASDFRTSQRDRADSQRAAKDIWARRASTIAATTKDEGPN